MMFSNQAPESNLTVVRFVLIDQSVASSSRLSCYQASSGYRSSTASSRHLSRSRDEDTTHWRQGRNLTNNRAYWSDDGAEYESQAQI